jgi:penicillin-binding protein-related factor A (putative recombinase)
MTVNIKNKIRGSLAKAVGDRFEAMMSNSCYRSKVVCTRIPNGAVMRYVKGKVIPVAVTSPFDFLLTYQGLTACVDCKTIDSGNFSYSSLTQHQVNSLMRIFESGVAAGYVVWFRESDNVVFFEAPKLRALRPRESLKESDGLSLGKFENFNSKLIFSLTREVLEVG